METKTTDAPSVWIGCLSCYNSGTLYGAWITAEDALEEHSREEITFKGHGTIQEYSRGGEFTACNHCGGDEWDVMDESNLPGNGWSVRRFYEEAEHLADLDGDTLEALQVLGGFMVTSTLPELIAYHEENYSGQWDSFQDFAEHFADETGQFDEVPKHVAHYIDWEAYARDLSFDYMYEGGHVWRSC